MDTSFMNFQVPVFLGDGIFRSLIIIKNKIGPNFVPCGTPAVTANQSEEAPPSLTHCLRLDRKLIIHGIRERLTPISIS